MAGNDGFLRPVPSDADSDDGRLYDPTVADGAGVDGNASGSTITVTASIISGVATGDANVAGQTISDNVTIVNGTATGDANVSGQTLTVAASVLAGAATGDANTGGQTISDNITIISGVATGDANVDGQTLTLVASIIPGVATGESVAEVVDANPGPYRGRKKKKPFLRIVPEPIEENDDDEVIMAVIKEFMRLAA